MSVQVKPGRWRLRNGFAVTVLYDGGMMAWPWRGLYNGHVLTWSRGGMFGIAIGPLDLVEYLGPTEEAEGEKLKRKWTISKRQYLGQDRPCIVSVCERFTVSVTEVTGRTEYQWILELQDVESDNRVVQFFDDLVMAMITANSLIYWRMGFSD